MLRWAFCRGFKAMFRSGHGLRQVTLRHQRGVLLLREARFLRLQRPFLLMIQRAGHRLVGLWANKRRANAGIWHGGVALGKNTHEETRIGRIRTTRENKVFNQLEPWSYFLVWLANAKDGSVWSGHGRDCPLEKNS